MFPSVKPEAVGWKWGLIIPPGPMNVTFLYIHSTKSREVCEDIKIFNHRLLSLGNHSHGVRIHIIIWFYLLEQIHPLKVTTPSTDPSEKVSHWWEQIFLVQGNQGPRTKMSWSTADSSDKKKKNLCLASCILQVTCLQEMSKPFIYLLVTRGLR